MTKLKHGNLDLMISIARSPERKPFIDFSNEAVVTLWGEIYARPKAKISTILDLDKKRIAIMKGGINGQNFQIFAKQFNTDCTFIRMDSLHDVLRAIEDKSVDAGVVPNLFGIIHHNEYNVIKTPIMFSPTSVYFGTPKGTNKQILTTIDQYLKKWKTDKDSYYNQRLDFWFGTKGYDREIIPQWLLLSITTLFIVVALFALWVKLLRKQIAQKTRDLRKSRERYLAIFNSLSDAIVIHDAENGSILDINDTMLSMVGCTKDEAMHTIDILTQGEPPYSAAEARQYIQKAAQGEDQLFEWKIWRKDGSNFWCEVGLKANVINDQKIIIAVARDIEERKQHEDQLRHAHRMEAIGSLAGGIAHDFNNILTGIFGYTELAKLNQTNPEKLDEYLEEIGTSAHRAKKLITQIQTFSKKHKSEKKPLQLTTVTEEVLKLLSSSIPATIGVTCDLNSTALVHADPTQLHQVILNLCTNSSHAMENSTGTLSISLKDIEFKMAQVVGKQYLQAGKYVILTIEDTGHGIDSETIKLIFDPYFTTKEQGKGTGLGLAMVQGIIESHGGGIDVQSTPGIGTTFSIYLPALQTGQESPEQGAFIQEPLVGGHEMILMVDDEIAIINSLSSILRNFGYRVQTFTDPLEALAAFEQDPAGFDLVLTDMTMPGLTGADLARKILAQRPDMPIIISTGNTEIINQKNATEIGITAYCAKPITMPILLASIRKALDE